MPGKVNPTQCEALTQVCVQVFGNHAAHHLRRQPGPLRAQRLQSGDGLQLPAVGAPDGRCGASRFTDNCVVGIEPRDDNIKAGARALADAGHRAGARRSATTTPPRSPRRRTRTARRCARRRSAAATSRRRSSTRSSTREDDRTGVGSWAPRSSICAARARRRRGPRRRRARPRTAPSMGFPKPSAEGKAGEVAGAEPARGAPHRRQRGRDLSHAAARQALVQDCRPPHLDLARGAVLGRAAPSGRSGAHDRLPRSLPRSTRSGAPRDCRARCAFGCSTFSAIPARIRQPILRRVSGRPWAEPARGLIRTVLQRAQDLIADRHLTREPPLPVRALRRVGCHGARRAGRQHLRLLPGNLLARNGRNVDGAAVLALRRLGDGSRSGYAGLSRIC